MPCRYFGLPLKLSETRLKCLKALEAFHSGREYHHVKYVKIRERQRNYLILLKKDPVIESQLCRHAGFNNALVTQT